MILQSDGRDHKILIQLPPMHPTCVSLSLDNMFYDNNFCLVGFKQQIEQKARKVNGKNSTSKRVGSYGFVICVALRLHSRDSRIQTKNKSKIVNIHPKTISSRTHTHTHTHTHTVRIWFLQNRKLIPFNFVICVIWVFSDLYFLASLLPGDKSLQT